MDDNKHVELVCDNCHKSYIIHIRSMYRRKQFNRPNLCQECSRKAVADKNRETFKKPEVKKKISEKTKQGLKNITLPSNKELSNLIQTEYDEQCDLIKNGMRLSYEDHVEQERRIILRRNKESFMKLPNIVLHNLDMITNKPEVDFKELFPNNIITGYNYVSPFHRWDFKILTNKCDIFVDIDGSIHDKNKHDYIVTNDYGVKFNLRDSIQFKDIQRKYQTDNSPAYIIQCYNDKLNIDCKVINIYNDNIMPIKEFLNMILEYNKIPIINSN